MISLKPAVKKGRPLGRKNGPTAKITLKGISAPSPLAPESLATESHTLIRIPESLGLHPFIQSRLPLPISLQFSTPTKGSLNLTETDTEYPLKIVDLPCIIESQKCVNEMYYKIGDISQMIIVDETPASDEKTLDYDGHLQEKKKTEYPHGITPPLKHVRARRFRKVIKQQHVQDVEEQVERLLEADADALDVEFVLVERAEYEGMRFGGEEEEEEEFLLGLEEELGMEIENGEGIGAIGRDVDATEEADIVVNEEDEGDGTDDEEEDEEDTNAQENDDGEAAEDEYETLQKVALQNEISELREKIAEKQKIVDQSVNPVLKKRFEDVVKALKLELDIKIKAST